VNGSRKIEVGRRIRALRKEKGWTQAMLAQRIRRERSTIAKIEKGVIELSPLMLRAVSEAFGVNERWLLTGRGPKHTENTELLDRMEEKVRELGHDAHRLFVIMKSAYLARRDSIRAVLEGRMHLLSEDELADPALYALLIRVARICENAEKCEALRRLVDLLDEEKDQNTPASAPAENHT